MFHVLSVPATEDILEGDQIELTQEDLDEATEANLSDAYLSLAHLIDMDLAWILDNLHVVDMESIEATLERTEENVDQLIEFRSVMEYMGYDVPEYVPSFNEEEVDDAFTSPCPVCGSPDDVCDFVDPSVA
jgi:hypothetical protein